ncbi:MAG: ABC transporter permease [Candidatus Hinthialibacter antarcticus]|nr:ABC transporter permease [Candidatus Hinthialibacter antarcticus]
MKTLFRQKMVLAGSIITLTLVLVSFLGPLISPYTIQEQTLSNALSAPSFSHWMGTDNFGRDVLVRVMEGGRISLFVGVISQSIALIIGVPLGCLAGYFRGWTDGVVMWLVNVFWSFPYLLLVMAMNIAMADMFSPIVRVFIAVGLVSWVLVARIVRGQVMSVKENAYIEAARAFGFSTPRIIFRHLIPNIITPIFVVVTLGFAEAIIAEAALSFLGLGVEAPNPSWGQMIAVHYGRIFFAQGWWIAFFPGVAIMAAVLGLNLLGDGLRDFLDPHLKDELEGAR